MRRILGFAREMAGTLLITASAQGMAASDTVVVAKNLEDALTVDPAEAYENTAGEMLINVYSRLVRRNPDKSAEVIGDVALNSRVSG